MIKGTIFNVDGTPPGAMSIWNTTGEDYLRSVGCQEENYNENSIINRRE